MKKRYYREGHIGPFGDAAQKLETFASNFYMNELYAQTLEQLERAKADLDAAVLEGDMFKIERSREDLNILEEIIKLTTLNYASMLSPSPVDQ